MRERIGGVIRRKAERQRTRERSGGVMRCGAVVGGGSMVFWTVFISVGCLKVRSG